MTNNTAPSTFQHVYIYHFMPSSVPDYHHLIRTTQHSFHPPPSSPTIAPPATFAGPTYSPTIHKPSQLDYLPRTQHRPHQTTSNTVIQLLQSNQLHLQPFVLFNMIPPVPRPTLTTPFPNPITINPLQSLLLSKLSSTFNTETFCYTISAPSTSGFKSLPSNPTNSTYSSPLIASKWKQFWRLRIPLNARNTWYRFLHQKVATRQLLHQRQPDEFTPYCGICRPRGPYRRHANPPTENLSHFILTCPKKLSVWKKAITTHIDPQLTDFNMLHFFDILHLRTPIPRSSSVLFQQLSTYQVFACILQAIWSAHYRFAFDAIPFKPEIVLENIYKDLHKLDSEETMHSSS